MHDIQAAIFSESQTCGGRVATQENVMKKVEGTRSCGSGGVERTPPEPQLLARS